MTMNFIAGTELLLIFGLLLPTILFLRTQYLTLKRMRPEIRTIEPGLVWLQLIPTLNIIMSFIVVNGISNSLSECLIVNDPDSIFSGGKQTVGSLDPRPTFKTGISYSVFLSGSTIASLFTRSTVIRVDYLVPGFFLVAMACWILYWIELSKYSKQLKSGLIV